MLLFLSASTLTFSSVLVYLRIFILIHYFLPFHSYFSSHRHRHFFLSFCTASRFLISSLSYGSPSLSLFLYFFRFSVPFLYIFLSYLSSPFSTTSSVVPLFYLAEGKTALVNPCTCVRLSEYEFFIRIPLSELDCTEKRSTGRKLFTCPTSTRI